jgi:hypothetical protein
MTRTQELIKTLNDLRQMRKDYAEELIAEEIRDIKDQLDYERSKHYRSSSSYTTCHINGMQAATCPKLY